MWYSGQSGDPGPRVIENRKDISSIRPDESLPTMKDVSGSSRSRFGANTWRPVTSPSVTSSSSRVEDALTVRAILRIDSCCRTSGTSRSSRGGGGANAPPAATSAPAAAPPRRGTAGGSRAAERRRASCRSCWDLPPLGAGSRLVRRLAWCFLGEQLTELCELFRGERGQIVERSSLGRRKRTTTDPSEDDPLTCLWVHSQDRVGGELRYPALGDVATKFLLSAIVDRT